MLKGFLRLAKITQVEKNDFLYTEFYNPKLNNRI